MATRNHCPVHRTGGHAMNRPDSQSWQKCKPIGDAAELKVARWFAWRGFDVSKTIADLAGYDLLLSGRVEVKRDERADETGNLAIEVSRAGKPSGIMTSTSTLWVSVLQGEAIIVPTGRLREEIVNHPNVYREVAAGDARKTRCRLVPLADARKWPFVRVVRLEDAA